MIPHSRPSIGQDEVRAVTDVLRSGQVTEGPSVHQFERGMAAYFGLQGGVAVHSGTVAIELALRALGVGPGDNVILPSYVCSAPWLAIQRVGAQARLVDIDLDTFNVDPAKVRRARTVRTRAVIVPHLFGLPADLSATMISLIHCPRPRTSFCAFAMSARRWRAFCAGSSGAGNCFT